MNEQALSGLGRRLELAAAVLLYPATPNLAAAIGSRRRRPAPQLRWALAALVVAVASLFAVPGVRARVLEFLQVGAVRINLPAELAGSKVSHIARKRKPPQPVLNSIFELNGQTSLAEARAALNFPVELPRFPSSLGEPDRVYLQHTDLGDFVVLVWLDEEEQVELIQYVIERGVQLTKGTPDVVEVTSVNGFLAIWTNSEYLLDVDGYNQPMRFIDSPALIWSDGELTYRLEADLELADMVRIGESIP